MTARALISRALLLVHGQPDHLETRQWREIPGYEGRYSVSNLGEVRSESRRVESYGGRHRMTGQHVMKPRAKDGYPAVELFIDGIGKWRTIHSLVALAFIGPRPEGMQVCHNDGTRTNNVPTNLRYDTQSGNCADRRLHRALRCTKSPEFTE